MQYDWLGPRSSLGHRVAEAQRKPGELP